MRKRLRIASMTMLALVGPSLGRVAEGGELAPSATGRVVGPDFKPQVGVPLQVTGPEGKTTAFTDAKGQWSLYNLPPGEYQVKPAVGSLEASQPSAEFSIKGQGGLFGQGSGTYDAGEMKLSRSWQPYTIPAY